VSRDVERHRLALYLGEIKTCVQDDFRIEDWYNFEISERLQVLEGSWCVPSRLPPGPRCGRRSNSQTLPLGPRFFVLLLDAASKEKLQAGSLSPINYSDCNSSGAE
jgi:hypothetical protein